MTLKKIPFVIICPACLKGQMKLDDDTVTELCDPRDPDNGDKMIEAIILQCPKCWATLDIPIKIAKKRGIV